MIWQDKIGLAVTLTAVAAFFGGHALLGFQAQRTYDDKCHHLMAIARHPQKMKYVRTWVASRTQDEQFMAAVTEYPFIDRRDPTMGHYIDLDARYLGFAPTLVQFNDGYAPDVRAKGITTVSLHDGRPSIIIKLNAAGDVGAEWAPEDLSKLRPVGDDVFVYCD